MLSRATQVDRALDAVLDDRMPVFPPELGSELAVARALRADLPLVPAAPSFEEALARRLSQTAPDPEGLMHRFVRHHHRLVLTGALGSVLISTAGAAVVAWRLVHR